VLREQSFVQFSYDKTINDSATIIITAITDEEIYRFISPICLAWLAFDIRVEELAIPCAPILSCHPRSRVREAKNREEMNEVVVIAE